MFIDEIKPAGQIATLSNEELEMVMGAKSASGYFFGAGTVAVGAGSVVRGGLILAGVATVPAWAGVAFAVVGVTSIAYGGYLIAEALSD